MRCRYVDKNVYHTAGTPCRSICFSLRPEVVLGSLASIAPMMAKRVRSQGAPGRCATPSPNQFLLFSALASGNPTFSTSALKSNLKSESLR